MTHEIKIEECDVDNPELRSMFPDITKLKVKQEICEDAPEQDVKMERAWYLPITVELEEVSGTMISKEPPSAAGMSQENVYAINRNITENNECVHTNVKIENECNNTQFYIEISSKALDIQKEELISNNSQECDMLLKKEVLTCMVCSRESEEEMCKECIQQSVGLVPSNSLHNDNDITSRYKKDLEQKPLKCSIDQTSNKDQLNDHTRSKQAGEQNFSCSICDCKFTRRAHLDIHIRNHTGEKVHKCDLCDYKTTFQSSLQIHIRAEHTKEKFYSCDMCEYRSLTKYKIALHLRKHTGEKPYKCEFCEYRAAYKSQVTGHTKAIHTGVKIFSCSVCEHRFVTKSKLTQHLRKHTGEKPYACDFCDYRSSANDTLKAHVRAIHTNEKLFSCSVCEYRCVTKSKLNKHFRRHTGDRPYKCDSCDYRCSAKATLDYHIKSKHTKEKNYSCDSCEYKCYTKYQLDSHLRVHSGIPVRRAPKRPPSDIKPFKCDVCDRRFTQKGGLKIHVKTVHTKERLYACELCEYKTPTGHHLKRHLRTHTGERPYTCDFCDYRATQRCHVNDHMKFKHTNERNYVCDICEYRTATKSTLKQHRQRHNNDL